MTTYALQGPPHAGATVTLSALGGTVGDLAPTGQGVGLLIVNSATARLDRNLPVGLHAEGPVRRYDRPGPAGPPPRRRQHRPVGPLGRLARPGGHAGPGRVRSLGVVPGVRPSATPTGPPPR